MITLKEISKENINAILKLKVSEEQKDQVAPNAYSIAQGSVHDEAWYRGIYFNEIPVGFVMLSLEPEKNEFWIWRYMIDEGQQGKGYGKAAMLKVIEFMKTFPKIKEIKLSYVPKDHGGPQKFYAKLGFIDTDIMEEGEIVMKYLPD